MSNANAETGEKLTKSIPKTLMNVLETQRAHGNKLSYKIITYYQYPWKFHGFPIRMNFNSYVNGVIFVLCLPFP